MDTKKYIISAGIVATMLVGISSLAIAQDSNTVQPTTISASPARPQPTVVQIGPGGRTLLRGDIIAVGASSLTVKSWGGNWIINISADTELMPNSDMSQFKVGDFVGVQGIVNPESTDWQVTATLVRDWSVRKVEQENRQEIKDIIKEGTPRNWQGSASNLSGTSFTLTIDGMAYTVNVAAGAKIVNEKYSVIAFADIKTGDTVRVWGPVTDTTISASVVRDISIR